MFIFLALSLSSQFLYSFQFPTFLGCFPPCSRNTANKIKNHTHQSSSSHFSLISNTGGAKAWHQYAVAGKSDDRLNMLKTEDYLEEKQREESFHQS